MTTTDLWSIRNAAEDRYPKRFAEDGTSAARCTACGRKLAAKHLVVEVDIFGRVILPGDPRSEGPDSQGSWDIGPECVKQVLSPEQVRLVREAALR